MGKHGFSKYVLCCSNRRFSSLDQNSNCYPQTHYEGTNTYSFTHRVSYSLTFTLAKFNVTSTNTNTYTNTYTNSCEVDDDLSSFTSNTKFVTQSLPNAFDAARYFTSLCSADTIPINHS
eukprot:PhF_6_TR7952/c0_g1_i1/m.12007